MSDHDKASKTEKPTDKRIDEARQKGQFAKAPEIGVVFVLGAAFVVLLFSAKDKALILATQTAHLFKNLFDVQITPNTLPYLADELIQAGFVLLAPIFLSTVAAAIIAGGIQSGFRFTPKVIELNADKLNPMKGLKNIFSLQSLMQVGIDALKFVAIGLIIYGALKQIITNPLFYSPVSIGYLGNFILEVFLLMLVRLIAALSVIALLNYLYQRFQTTKNLMMTKEEIKDEHKQSQGDPHVRMAQRRLAQQFLQKQMLSSVPTADVVVTNPTHYAVALRYERGKDKAPMVLAKGKNLFAQKIKTIAIENEVPIKEDKPTARLLYRLGKVGETIPVELYQVVAEILAYVYKTHRYYFHRLKARRLKQ